MLIACGSHRIHADLLGERGQRAVCLVHSLGADMTMWAEQVPALLDAGYAVLRIELRGHGGSDAPQGPYRMEDLGADLARVLDSVALGPVDYVGLSLGGMSGQALALDRPDLLRSVVICDALPESLPNADDIWGPRIRAGRAARSCGNLPRPGRARCATFPPSAPWARRNEPARICCIHDRSLP
jgi:3-oxoadipate enol-lactonase